MLGDLDPEQREDGEQEVVRQPGPGRDLERALSVDILLNCHNSPRQEYLINRLVLDWEGQRRQSVR